jgi:hypothetical protein
VIDCLFADNGALGTGEGQFGNGGGIYVDGAYNSDIAQQGDLVLCGTTFSHDLAQQHGSGLFSYFYAGSNSRIDSCTFDDNSFDGSPSGGAGTLYHEAVPLTLANTTLSNNRSGGQAAGLFLGSTPGTSADITNCTFAGNSVPTGNGAAIFDGASPITIESCTFSGNEADYGPAIFKGQSASITVKNSLFADNKTQNQYSALACHEPLGDGGGNLQWPQTKPSGSPDAPCVEGITFADPLLGPLADHGGPTKTMALGAGSPAIDAASGCPATDQRGEPRGATCDSGAYEAAP